MRKNFGQTMLLALPLLTGGCATISFAPPAINSDKVVSADGKCLGTESSTSIVKNSVAGAQALIENYRVAYSCAGRKLADGRQFFEVPSALALAGGALAAALGAGPDVAIATGAFAATANHGNSYYAPKQKAHVVAAAHNAVVCIKQEAAGIPSINAAEAAAAPLNAALIEAGRGFGAVPPAVNFSPGNQYYQMVSASLESVDAILAERLSSIGSYSANAIATEIAALTKEKDEAESDDGTAATGNAKALGATGNAQDVIINSELELGKLHPRLKLCVIQAKAG